MSSSHLYRRDSMFSSRVSCVDEVHARGAKSISKDLLPDSCVTVVHGKTPAFRGKVSPDGVRFCPPALNIERTVMEILMTAQVNRCLIRYHQEYLGISNPVAQRVLLKSQFFGMNYVRKIRCQELLVQHSTCRMHWSLPNRNGRTSDVDLGMRGSVMLRP